MRRSSSIFQLLPLTIALFFCNGGLNGQNSLSTDFRNLYGFGKSLYLEHDYKRAIAEFNNALVINNLNGLNYGDSINYLIGMAYSRMANYELSNEYLQNVSIHNSGLFERATLQSAKNMIFSNRSLLAISMLEDLEEKPFSYEYSVKSQFLRASAYLMLNLPQPASETIVATGYTNSELYELTIRLKEFIPKRQFLAGFYSAIVPGAGKFYSLNYEDGLMSMFTVGLFGFRTAMEYRTKGFNSVNFWVFGLATLYFYAGNVYGSAVSAKQYNEQFYKTTHKKVLEFVDIID